LNIDNDRYLEDNLSLKKELDNTQFNFETEKKINYDVSEKYEYDHLENLELKKKIDYERNKYEIEHTSMLEYQRKLKQV